MSNKSLLDFCKTDKHRQIIALHLEGVGSRAIEEKLDSNSGDGSKTRKIIARIKQAAEDRGFDPENHRTHVVPSQQIVTGYSDLVRYAPDDPLGRIIGWIKTNRKLAEQLEGAKEIIEAMASEVPRLKPAVFKGVVTGSHEFTVIPVGDPHIGLRTWSKEVGTNWDVDIAQRVFEKVFRRLMERSPDTDTAVLFNSGDFFHADNIAGETSRSGHKLDLDGRPGYWIDAGVRIMRMLIDMALSKYKAVHFINTPGNHDDILGLTIGVIANNLYEKDPRFSCSPGLNAFQYYERNKVALGFCHGHTCKLPSLPGKMADDMAEMWGRTLYRQWFTGHVHHNQWLQFKEHPGCTVESIGIIPPKDAYSHGKAYGSGRNTQLVVLDDRGFASSRYMEMVLKTD